MKLRITLIRLSFLTFLIGLFLVSSRSSAETSPYESYYQSIYEKCHQSAENQGTVDCPAVVKSCLNRTFECLKKYTLCSIEFQDGEKIIVCPDSLGSTCLLGIPTITMQLILETNCDEDFLFGELELDQAGCGNRVLELDEICDDGNTQNGDGCHSTCIQPDTLCGNGKLDPGEECDAGLNNGMSTSECDNQCDLKSQGDGAQEGLEQPGMAQKNTTEPTISCSIPTLRIEATPASQRINLGFVVMVAALSLIRIHIISRSRPLH